MKGICPYMFFPKEGSDNPNRAGFPTQIQGHDLSRHLIIDLVEPGASNDTL